MNYFVGIDIGGTNVEIGILNAQGDILGKESIKTESKKGAEDTFNRIWNKTKELAEKLKIQVEDIEAIGLGIPGPVVNNSVVKIAANFSWNNDFPAKDLMEKVTGKPVKIFEFKDELKKYMEDLNMNPKNMERSLNVGFSGGEKKKNEILQMLVLNPKLAILDETDSGLDVDAIKTVSKGIEMFKNDENAVLIITHNNKILHSLKVDYVHVLVDGKIVATGTQELATEIEENGYSKYKKMKN